MSPNANTSGTVIKTQNLRARTRTGAQEKRRHGQRSACWTLDCLQAPDGNTHSATCTHARRQRDWPAPQPAQLSDAINRPITPATDHENSVPSSVHRRVPHNSKPLQQRVHHGGQGLRRPRTHSRLPQCTQCVPSPFAGRRVACCPGRDPSRVPALDHSRPRPKHMYISTK